MKLQPSLGYCGTHFVGHFLGQVSLEKWEQSGLVDSDWTQNSGHSGPVVMWRGSKRHYSWTLDKILFKRERPQWRRKACRSTSVDYMAGEWPTISLLSLLYHRMMQEAAVWCDRLPPSNIGPQQCATDMFDRFTHGNGPIIRKWCDNSIFKMNNASGDVGSCDIEFFLCSVCTCYSHCWPAVTWYLHSAALDAHKALFSSERTYIHCLFVCQTHTL